MSDDVNKDILKAIKDSKNSKEVTPGLQANIPEPKVVQHSLNETDPYVATELRQKND